MDRYERYTNRIRKIAAIRKVIFRFRLPIIILFSTLVVGSATLVGTKGIVSDKQFVMPSYTYGESVTISASAFMSDSSYEYALTSSSSWSEEKPIYPGSYKLRSKARNSFNGFYYGAEQYFQILAKDISVSISAT